MYLVIFEDGTPSQTEVLGTDIQSGIADGIVAVYRLHDDMGFQEATCEGWDCVDDLQ